MDSEDDAQSMSPSQSFSPPRPHAGRGHVTIAAPPRPGKTLGPIRNPRPGSGREDCWSEGATSALIDAWGERFLELGRGNLRQKQWQEVADAVSSRDDYTKTPKTDIQCKNRIDTLKKKYKAEKSKRNSRWPFFNRLDHLIRPGPGPCLIKPSPSNKAAAAVAAALHPSFPKRSRTYHPTHKKRSPSPSPSGSLSAASSSSDSYPPMPPSQPAKGRLQQEPDEPAIEERVRGLRELSQAIVQFGTVYERVETSKLRQTMEMEKQRMELARELQLQRIHFLIKTQAELSHLRQPPTKRKRSSSGVVTTSNNINNNSSS